MSSSTTLYAINLHRLQETLGSKDRKLVKAIEDLNRSQPLSKHRRQEHWVAVLEDGRILLDRSESSIDDVKKAYSKLGKLDAVHFLGRQEGAQKRLFEMFGAMTAERKGDAGKILFHPASMDLDEFHAYDDAATIAATIDPDLLAAVKALVNGKITRRIGVSDCGYALQQLCRVLGQRLPDEDLIGDIGSLDLASRLSLPRTFPGVPADGDFPILSYLTDVEVKQEVADLRSKGVASSKDPDIEAGRAALLRCLEQAAAQNQSVVAFYY
jgi:hypothetical protein